MEHYNHLSISERKEIYRFIDRKMSIREIATALGRAFSTICRELNRYHLYPNLADSPKRRPARLLKSNVLQKHTLRKNPRRRRPRQEIILLILLAIMSIALIGIRR